MSHETLECILKRRSCRHFTGEPLKQGDLERLMEVARWAPSAGNRQPWFFYVVHNEQIKHILVEAALGQGFIAQAPVVFVACMEPETSATRYGVRGRTLYAIQDVAAAVENLIIAATSLGYGSCWVGAFDEDAVRRALHVPNFRKPVALLPVGSGVFDSERTERRPSDRIFEIVP